MSDPKMCSDMTLSLAQLIGNGGRILGYKRGKECHDEGDDDLDTIYPGALILNFCWYVVIWFLLYRTDPVIYFIIFVILKYITIIIGVYTEIKLKGNRHPKCIQIC